LVVEDWGLSGVADLAATVARLTRDASPDGVAPIPADEARRYWPEEPAPEEPATA
jgi:hypothetical protein